MSNFVERHGSRAWPRRCVLRLVPLLLLTVFLACSRAPEPVGRVLLVGIDGAAPELMRSLGERGRIPGSGRQFLPATRKRLPVPFCLCRAVMG